MDRDPVTGFALLRPDRTSAWHRSRCSTSSKATPRRAGCKFPKQAEAHRARDFAETISWHLTTNYARLHPTEDLTTNGHQWTLMRQLRFVFIRVHWWLGIMAFSPVS